MVPNMGVVTAILKPYVSQGIPGFCSKAVDLIEKKYFQLVLYQMKCFTKQKYGIFSNI